MTRANKKLYINYMKAFLRGVDTYALELELVCLKVKP